MGPHGPFIERPQSSIALRTLHDGPAILWSHSFTSHASSVSSWRDDKSIFFVCEDFRRSPCDSNITK